MEKAVVVERGQKPAILMLHLFLGEEISYTNANQMADARHEWVLLIHSLTKELA